MPNRLGRDSSRRRQGHVFQRETNLERRVGTRTERRAVLIVTNGERTECDYFEALRQEPWITGKVKVKVEKGDPAAVVRRATQIRDDNGYDEAWAVCDADEFDVTSLLAGMHDPGVVLALSVPCFEVWLILHLSAGCRGSDNARQAGDFLKKILPTWDKTALSFDDFRAGVFDAVYRARKLEQPPHGNPSTAVWRLIESLRRT